MKAKAKCQRRIDRNHYDYARVLEMVEDHTSGEAAISEYELIRLLEESAHAYSMLRDDAREMWRAFETAGEILKDKHLERKLW